MSCQVTTKNITIPSGVSKAKDVIAFVKKTVPTGTASSETSEVLWVFDLCHCKMSKYSDYKDLIKAYNDKEWIDFLFSLNDDDYYLLPAAKPVAQPSETVQYSSAE